MNLYIDMEESNEYEDDDDLFELKTRIGVKSIKY